MTILFLVVFSASHIAVLVLSSNAVDAQTCFNNPACWRKQVGWPRARAKTTTISWDMDSSSFSSEWAWKDIAPNVNFENAANHSAYEWSVGYLDWDQQDSCSQARSTGNGVACIGVRNWCKWLGGYGLPGLVSIYGVAKSSRRFDCDLPSEWYCLAETSIRLNGYVWWKDSECGVGTQNLTSYTPKNPIPSDDSDPRLKPRCKSRTLPKLAKKPNVVHVTVHEFGHAVHLTDIDVDTCLPDETVMEGYHICDLVLPCPSQFTTLSDQTSVRYLYGP